MASNSSSSPFLWCCILIFCSMALTSAALHISYDALKAPDGDHGRRLGFAKLSKCPINFRKVDFSPLLSKCKGPPYPAKPCCDGFREISCRYAEELNDVDHNSCALDMFYHINRKGKYPVGLFFELCTSPQIANKNQDLSCDGIS